MDKNRILVALSESRHTDFGKKDFDLQSLPQKVFSAIWSFESEVNNGGFSQYFFNYSCETAGFVVSALETIGAPQTADICRRAIALTFPQGLPSQSEEIRMAASEFPDEVLNHLDSLDREFYRYPHDLTELLFAYVAQYPSEFGNVSGPGDV